MSDHIGSKMGTISAAQLRAIKAKVSGLNEDQHALPERKALHARSREMTSMWPDALQARRQRKQMEREQRFAREEALRAELDRQDAAEIEQARLEKLREAARKLWQQTDEMKTLQRGQLLADVACQRQKQLEEHLRRAAAQRASDFAFLAEQEHQRQEALRREDGLAHASREKTIELSRAREEQLDDFKARLLAERDAARRDGAEIQEQAMRHARHEVLEEEKRTVRAIRAVRETEQANQALLALKRQQQEQEQLADAAIADYRAKKAAAEEEGAAALAAKAAAKEAQRRHISQMLENNFLEKQKESSTRQSIAAEQARMKKDSTAAETAKRRAARAAEVERSRREQIAHNKAQAEQRVREQQATSEQITAILQAVKIEQEEKIAHCRAQNVAHAAFLQHQIEVKQARQEQSSQ